MTQDPHPGLGIKEVMQQQRESIPPNERCPVCDGNGMILNEALQAYGPCPSCGTTGKKTHGGEGSVTTRPYS
jgi:ssDNA-binding Zn-finger/Zn-ribbon topoisomerase 1